MARNTTIDPIRLEPAYDVIRRFVDEGKIPGAVAQVGTAKDVFPTFAYGSKSLVPSLQPIQTDTIYDCASITKVVATTTLVLLLLQEGRLHLDEPVVRYIPELSEHAVDTKDIRAQIKIRHLLTHTSGLPAWKPLYKSGGDKAGVLHTLCTTPLENPVGTAVTYSCLGYILLGVLLERVTDTPLDTLARERIFHPLEMNDTCFAPPARLLARIAPTEQTDEGLIHGIVHDENARSVGGISGNAGLFSTAPDLAHFAQMILSRGEGAHNLLTKATIAEATRHQTKGLLGDSRGLGWQLKGDSPGPAGDFFGPESFGHTGFTGTSLWIDPRRNVFAILLTNRVHPTRKNLAHLDLRPRFHNAVAAALF